MATVKLRNDQWKKMATFLHENPRVYVGQEKQCRRFIEGVLWLLRSGAQWRLLPTKYGNWNTVYKRFDRWSEKGIWKEMFAHFVDDPDMERLLLDSTVVRAHACAAGAARNQGGQQAQALGRSRGGFSSKIHVGTDALGNPVRLLLTAGERHEAPLAPALVEGFEVEQVLGDKAYDTESILREVEAMGATAVIPPRANRVEVRAYDTELYKERHLVECFIGKIKHYRRVFSRFDKLARNYLAFLHFASTLIWLR